MHWRDLYKILFAGNLGSSTIEVSENPAELTNLPNISANHKKTKCMDAKWPLILELAMVLVA